MEAPGDEPAWEVELRARVGPFARSKRLRMALTEMVTDRLVVFERAEIDGRAVVRRAQQAERAVGVGGGVQRLGGMVLGVPVAVGEIGFFFLEVGGVGKQDLQQRLGPRSAVHDAAIPEPVEARQVAGVVDVRVREHDRRQPREIVGPRMPVS